MINIKTMNKHNREEELIKRVLINRGYDKDIIDKDMKKKDLCIKAGISPASVTKMGKGGHVTTETLEKICLALDCRVEDIMKLEPGEDHMVAEKSIEDYSQGYEMEMTM